MKIATELEQLKADMANLMKVTIVLMNALKDYGMLEVKTDDHGTPTIKVIPPATKH